MVSAVSMNLPCDHPSAACTHVGVAARRLLTLCADLLLVLGVYMFCVWLFTSRRLIKRQQH